METFHRSWERGLGQEPTPAAAKGKPSKWKRRRVDLSRFLWRADISKTGRSQVDELNGPSG